MIDELRKFLLKRYDHVSQLHGRDFLIIKQRSTYDKETRSWGEGWELRLPLEKPRDQSDKGWHYDNMGRCVKELGMKFYARTFQSVVSQALTVIKTYQPS